MKVILASSSEARQGLLKEIIANFEIHVPDVDEEKIKDPIPSQRVKKISRLKAETVWERFKSPNNSLIISADSLVYFRKRFIGKPKNIANAKQILRDLSGSTHALYTGFCLIKTDRFGNKKVVQGFDKTRITFRILKEKEILDFVKKFKVLTFAGGYTIEPLAPGKGFFKEIKGSKTNVIGLPLEKLKKELIKLKILLQ